MRFFLRALPALRNATWVVFVDPTEDPFFRDNTRKLGPLEIRPRRGVTWLGPEQQEYMVVVGPTANTPPQGRRSPNSRS